MFHGCWTAPKFKLSILSRSVLGTCKLPRFCFLKGTWVVQAGVNFHQNGRTHPHGKAEKTYLIWVPAIKYSRIRALWTVHSFLLEVAETWWGNNFQERHQKPGMEPLSPSILPPFHTGSYKKCLGARLQHTKSQDKVFQHCPEIKEVQVNTHNPGLLEHHWEAFVKGWIRPWQLCNGRKLSPPAAQNKQAFFLWDISLVICSVTRWLGPSLLVFYQQLLLRRKPFLDSSGETVVRSHLRGMCSLEGELPGKKWACLKFAQAPQWFNDSQTAEPW